MKNIKKYLIYSIIFLISLFIYNKNVKADTNMISIFDYDSEAFHTLYTDIFLNKLADLKIYIDTENTYNRHYIISVSSSTVYISLDLANSLYMNKYCETGGYYNFGFSPYKRTSSLYSIQSNLFLSSCDVNGQSRSMGSKLLTISYSDFLNDNYNTVLADLKTYLNAGKINNNQVMPLFNQLSTSAYSNEWPNIYYPLDTVLNSNQASASTFPFIYYATREVKFINRAVYNNKTSEELCQAGSSWENVSFYYNSGIADEYLSCGATLPTYLDYMELNNKPITVDTLIFPTINVNNHEEYNSRAKLTINIDEDYTQYTTNCNFIDIFNNTTNFTVNEEYEFNAWYNGTLTCNITNNNELVYEYTYNLNYLKTIDLVDTYSTTFSDDTLYSVNVNYNFGSIARIPEYIPFKIEYLAQESTNLNTFINEIQFYYTNGNSQRYQTDLITLKDFKCRKTNSNFITCDGYIQNLESFQNFDINFIMNTFNEETNILYYDNIPNWSIRNIDFLESDFIGYKRYNLDRERNRIYIYKSQSNASNTGNIYFPYTLNHSNTIDMISFYYTQDGMFETHLPATIYNDYYEYYSINFTDTSGVLLITFDNTNFDIIKDEAYIYVPNDWLVQMHGTTHLGVILTDNDDNKIVISNDYNNTLINKAYNINTLFDGVKGYLESIKQYTNIFTDEITYFWGKLNNEQQTFFVSMFILIVITSIIYVARRH